MSIEAKLTANIQLRQTKYVGAADNQGALSAGKADGYKKTLSGASQVNVCVVKRAEIAASGNLSLDLSGSLVDLFGDAAVFATVSSLQIVNHSDAPLPIDGTAAAATAAAITVAGNFITSRFGASSSWPLPAGAKVHYGPGTLTVTNTSADTITITNASATEAAYVDVIITGKSS